MSGLELGFSFLDQDWNLKLNPLKSPLYVGGSNLLYLTELLVYGGRWVRAISSQSHDLHVIMVAISGAGCWDCMQENPPLFITACAE